MSNVSTDAAGDKVEAARVEARFRLGALDFFGHADLVGLGLTPRQAARLLGPLTALAAEELADRWALAGDEP
jgi:hypothetical protein